MRLTITSVDYAPPELHSQLPIGVELFKMMPGPDRRDYWLGKAECPIKWINDNIEKNVTHVIIAARWQGTYIDKNFKNLPVGIAYVTDASLVEDKKLDLKKCKYIAIGMSSVGTAIPEKLDHILSGNIGRSFGVGQYDVKSKNTWLNFIRNRIWRR